MELADADVPTRLALRCPAEHKSAMKQETVRRCLNALLACTFVFWASGRLDASNHVTVATIGNRPPAYDPAQGMQKIVVQVTEFWRKELRQVLPDKPDLILLPEACDRSEGLTDEQQSEYYRARKDQVLDFFASVAKENHCYIVFGTKRQQQDGIWRNSSIVLDRGGKVAGIYNKNFPTIGEIEDGIVPGDEVPLFNCDFGKVACAICFDLNFEELLQKFARAKPDIILFSSMYHGGLMQGYWAYRCRSFFVGAVGFREAPSEIRGPLGNVVASTSNYFDFTLARINLDNRMVHLDYNWGKLKDLKEKYGKDVTITDPGRLGVVLITSEHERVTAGDMVKEFQMELLDDYFNRSRAARSDRKKSAKD
jgi:predicted amidohydrolase